MRMETEQFAQLAAIIKQTGIPEVSSTGPLGFTKHPPWQLAQVAFNFEDYCRGFPSQDPAAMTKDIVRA